MSEKLKLIDPFVNIEEIPVESGGDRSSSSTTLSEVRELSVGQGGNNVFRADEQGIWLGGDTFASAPFKVSMLGALTASSATFSQYLNKTTDSLDDVNDGASYGKVLTTSISAGAIILSECSGDLDDVGDGSTYKKTTANEKTGGGRAYNGLDSSYQITKGIVDSDLAARSLPTNGVRLDVSGLYGRKSGVTTFYINSSGDAYFKGTIGSGTAIVSPSFKTAESGSRIEINSSGYTNTFVVKDDSHTYLTIGTGYVSFLPTEANNLVIRATKAAGADPDRIIITAGALANNYALMITGDGKVIVDNMDLKVSGHTISGDATTLTVDSHFAPSSGNSKLLGTNSNYWLSLDVGIVNYHATAVAETDETKFNYKLPIKINGSTYYMMLTTT